MKKQKFDSKLRLKKNVVSSFNAEKVRGGETELCTGTCETVPKAPFPTCACTAVPECDPATTLHVECHTIHIQSDCACL